MAGLSKDNNKIYCEIREIYDTSRISLRLFLSDLTSGETFGDTNSRTIRLKADPLRVSIDMSIRYANPDEKKILESLENYLNSMMDVQKNSGSKYSDKLKTACELLVLDKKYGFDSIRKLAFNATIDGKISPEYLESVKKILSDIDTSCEYEALPEKSIDMGGVNDKIAL